MLSTQQRFVLAHAHVCRRNRQVKGSDLSPSGVGNLTAAGPEHPQMCSYTHCSCPAASSKRQARGEEHGRRLDLPCSCHKRFQRRGSKQGPGPAPLAGEVPLLQASLGRPHSTGPRGGEPAWACDTPHQPGRMDPLVAPPTGAGEGWWTTSGSHRLRPVLGQGRVHLIFSSASMGTSQCFLSRS